MSNLDWMVVTSDSNHNGPPIGAVAFSNNAVAMVVAFQKTGDKNKDGTVDLGERAMNWVGFSSGTGTAAVLAQAVSQYTAVNVANQTNSNYNPRKLYALRQAYAGALMKRGSDLIADAIWKIYVGPLAKKLSGALASKITRCKVVESKVSSAFESQLQTMYKNTMKGTP